MSRPQGEVVGLGEGDDGLETICGGTKTLREFLCGKEMTVSGTGRIIELRQQIGQVFTVAKRKADGQVDSFCGVELPNGPQSSRRPRNVALHNFKLVRRRTGQEREEHRTN